MEEKVRREGCKRGAANSCARGGERAIKTAGSGPVDSEPDPQRGEFKKMVSPSSRRRAVKHIIGEGLGSADPGQRVHERRCVSGRIQCEYDWRSVSMALTKAEFIAIKWR